MVGRVTTPARDLLATWEREQPSGDLAYEAAHMHQLLDEFGVPRRDADGRRYPLVGRLAWLLLPLVRSGWLDGAYTDRRGFNFRSGAGDDRYTNRATRDAAGHTDAA